MTDVRQQAEAAVEQAIYNFLYGDEEGNQPRSSFKAHFVDAMLPLLKAQRAAECEAVIKEFRDNYDGADEKWGIPGFLKWLSARAKEYK
jgi:hypothetical protein